MELPVLVIRGFVLFPGQLANFEVAREISIRAIEEAIAEGEHIFIGIQQNPMAEDPGREGLYSTILLARIMKLFRVPGEQVRVMVEAKERCRLVEVTGQNPFRASALAITPEEDAAQEYDHAMMRLLRESFEEYASLVEVVPETAQKIEGIETLSALTDELASDLALEYGDKVALFTMEDPRERGQRILQLLQREKEILRLKKEIQGSVVQGISKNQKDAYLREQLHVIQEALGEGKHQELKKFKPLLQDERLPPVVREKIEKELHHLSELSIMSPEYSLYAEYLEQIAALPWGVKSEETISIPEVRRKLDEDHQGLQKVKGRVLEYLAVRKISPSASSPILCLVGPPGVGKTSIAASIAEAIGRRYVRISLGGVRDEAEIRGHRKTYIGAMPGRIINGLRLAKTANPLMLLDEIDKMASDLRGDPTAALLEVLDTSLNHEFRDAYIEVPFDLSDVFFIATANSLTNVPRPLLDRMEIIEMESYTPFEKVSIAQRHLLPKLLKRYGLKKTQIKVRDAVYTKIIQGYTREAGVRDLERNLDKICRKALQFLVEQNKNSVTITEKNLETYLGSPIYFGDTALSGNEIGLVNGLAWTSVGGDILRIEACVMGGSGKLEMTGRLGEVMRESAHIAYSYLRSIAEDLGLQETFFKKHDFHLHIPEGAVPKDGPSAGITMAVALISAATKKPVRMDTAMTGELTLQGRVLPIGGLKEKLLAAKQQGIDRVLVPEQNRRQVAKLEPDVTDGMTIQYVSNMDEVTKLAFAEE